MRLNDLLARLPEKQVWGKTDHLSIEGVVYDPLRTKPGFLFVAINIYTQLDKVEIPDGHAKINAAIANGAVAVVCQNDVPVPEHVVRIKVPNSRYALALLADAFYEHPSGKLKLLAVTGTNGKTTTTHIVESIFIQKHSIGLIGTLYYKLQGEICKSKDTTPEPPDLQAILKQMADRQFDYCVLEASSHGIDFHRLGGCNFDVAAFTNLTQDHLDYHKTMDAYRNTKMRLFQWLTADKFAVINRDDPSADYFIQATRAQVITYGIEKPATIMAKNIRYSIKGTDFTLTTPRGEVEIHTHLVGRFNVYNALTAAGMAYSQEIPLAEISSGLARPIRVAGRFEVIDKGQPYSVVVDYAHTPDGLENVLRLARELRPHRILTVFGCGGDRDKEKRPIMGKIADTYSDLIIVTADNPRNEDPAVISREIMQGIQRHAVQVELDRRRAIEMALQQAEAGDIVMLCGKGHETTQTVKEYTFHFNDREVAEELLAERLHAGK
ncbi:UDP-N-acetylmuramoyl-L-alanyl-D-glutamate--2,6-diaminopimelate ligase [candidate division KSB1 bacterium]|nr:UDP-N-acetylmuramoyl-L-alanyl-D-glutamate--2,6-diaminopimelate ligase [candidate division KSB1 bacterium]